MSINKSGFFEETQDLVESYVSNRIRLLKLQAAEKTSGILTAFIAAAVIVFLSVFILLFISIVAGFYLSELLHSHVYGFGIVALLYIVLLVVAVLLRKSLDTLIFEKMISILFESNRADDELHP